MSEWSSRRLAACGAALLSGLFAAGSVGAQPGTGTLVGKVFADTTLRTLVDAEILLPQLNKRVTSDAKGAFRIRGIPSGQHVVRARMIGYALFEARIEVQENGTTDLAVVLPRVTLLDSLRVVGAPDVPMSYLEHRAVGLGHFMSRAELDAAGNRRLADVMNGIAGLGIVQGRAGQGWPLSKRVAPSLRKAGKQAGNMFYGPDATEQRSGMVPGCYARVYLDKLLLNPSTPAEPVNLNDYFASGLEAIEYYAGPSQTPFRYSTLNSSCGVVVLHSRRSPSL